MNADIGSGTPLGSLPVKLALGRYSGDWDCSGAAMLFLGHELEQRSGMAFSTSSKPVDLDDPALKDLPFVYLSGHEDFVFSDAELQNLRQYLEGGGHLWIDDSTHFEDTRFDTAVRRELSRLLPGRTFKRLPEDFEAMRTGYDLSGGYRGYRIPPGDKYRLDYFEGIELDGRVAVVYTRNDYGDGLNIDPHTHPLAESLTDLSPAEMQEGALRMGINLVLFFLEQRAGGVREHLHETRLELRSSAAPADPVSPAGKAVALEAAADSAQWQGEDWADAVTLRQEGQGIRVAFSHGPQKKNAITHTLDPAIPFERSQAFVVDVHSHLNSGARLAAGFFSGDEFYESRPYFLKPGKNTAVFPLDDEHFKSARTGWEYSGRFPETLSVDRLTLLIYAPGDGAVSLQAPRLVHGD